MVKGKVIELRGRSNIRAVLTKSLGLFRSLKLAWTRTLPDSQEWWMPCSQRIPRFIPPSKSVLLAITHLSEDHGYWGDGSWGHPQRISKGQREKRWNVRGRKCRWWGIKSKAAWAGKREHPQMPKWVALFTLGMPRNKDFLEKFVFKGRILFHACVKM